jgi:alpha-methylacyl-CoA racemase
VSGPLNGITVVELAGLGPGPWAGTVLADLGAEVIRVERLRPSPLEWVPHQRDPLNRGRRSIAIDVKSEEGREAVLRMVESADVLLEGFRPGVTERLGLGPDVCLGRNPGLVYARVTGWGQDGPLAHTAGHDIDYIAVAGALRSIGRSGESPIAPVNYLGDYAGGGMLVVVGILAALVERSSSGRGQVVDAAMVDGVALIQLLTYSLLAAGLWRDERGVNMLDGAAPFYDTYECADGEYVAVGALEPQFFAALVDGLGLDVDPALQLDMSGWDDLRARIAAAFRSRTRDEWAEVFSGTDACVAPVLSLAEAPRHPHLAERGTFVEVDGVVQPAPAPRFSRSAPDHPATPPMRGADTDSVLQGLGYDAAAIADLRERGVIA